MRVPLFRLLIVALAALVLISPSIDLLAVIANRGRIGLEFPLAAAIILQFMAAVVGVAIALTLAVRLPHRPDARALAVLAAALPAIPGSVLPSATSLRADAVLWSQIAAVLLSVAAFVRFSEVFAGDHGKRRPGVFSLAILLSAAVIPIFFLHAGALRTALELALAALIATGVAYGLRDGGLSLRTHYLAAAAADRKKLFWLAEGALVFIFGLLLLPLALGALLAVISATGMLPEGGAWFHALLQRIAILATLFCLALAMFYDGALDPALVVRRTALYGVLTVAGVFVFAILENAVAGLLGGAGAASWISGGLAAFVLMPVHAWLRNWLNKPPRLIVNAHPPR